MAKATFGNTILALRKRKGLTQAAVAEAVRAELAADKKAPAAAGAAGPGKPAGGDAPAKAVRAAFDASYLSKIEHGVVDPPSGRAVRALAKVLRGDAFALMALAGKVPDEVRAVCAKSRGARAFLREASRRNLTERQWAGLLDGLRKAS